jgi:hypothetical protein
VNAKRLKPVEARGICPDWKRRVRKYVPSARRGHVSNGNFDAGLQTALFSIQPIWHGPNLRWKVFKQTGRFQARRPTIVGVALRNLSIDGRPKT